MSRDFGGFAEKILQRVAELDSRLVVGIDPDPDFLNPLVPGIRAAFGGDPEDILRRFCRTVLEAVADQAVCVKPQAAFFEAWGLPGMRALADCIGEARRAGVPVILDAKRGDVGNTARAYARAYLDPGSPFFSDALTVNPYLGEDALWPFVEAASKNGCGLFVLVRTSNPASGTVQSLPLKNGGTVAESVATLVNRLAEGLIGPSGYSPVGAVVGLTHPEDVLRLRNLMPRSLLLLPGFGAQGGRAEDASCAFHPGGKGALVSASRSITLSFLRAQDGELLSREQVAEDMRTRAIRAREEINRAALRSST
ncbi:MAG: orotidine-5'-phosphate decarboxylase [Firmicutes bacterium]|nr:orotidine-5'-phosphate decarboxylase [Candidatus Fermentithermobacillaceae bacterium]